jgi:hypothetical protein
VWRAIDLVLRVVYVVVAPLLLATIASIVPITGTLVGAGIAMVIALIGSDRWHARVDRVPVLGRVLGGMGKLGDFYREHPPKPLIYYILYPLLLPVLVFLRVPRREFLLYRKVNTIALLVVVVGGTFDYYRNWRPELTFGMFAASMIVALLFQLLATFALAMPIVTTLVLLRMRALTKSLAIVAVLATASGVVGYLGARSVHGSMQISTWMRLSLRTGVGMVDYRKCVADHEPSYRGCGRENHAFNALVDALNAVYITLRDHPGDADAALDQARAKLGEYYKPDETAAWRLYTEDNLYMLYVKFGHKKRLWLARDVRQVILDPAKLPAGARTVLGLPPPPSTPPSPPSP